jgi:hypothetical protein
MRTKQTTLVKKERGFAATSPPARRFLTRDIRRRTNIAAKSHMMPNMGTGKFDLGLSDAVAHSRIMKGSTMSKPIRTAALGLAAKAFMELSALTIAALP